MSDLRIPFEEAVGEERLLKRRWLSLSVPQRVTLKALYGLPLLQSQVCTRTGLNEREIYAALQGHADYDELGFPTAAYPERVRVWPTREYPEAWGIIGRRGSKTDAFAATVVAYESTLGGHEQYVRAGQRTMFFQIAQDLRMARYTLFFIRAALESSPILSRMITQVTADRIDLKNSNTIATIPPTLKSTRGYANALAVLDEVGVWYQEAESANPDYEIYRAVIPGQLQFPNKKILGISTPWNKAGLLYRNWEAGTEGTRLPLGTENEYRNTLVLQGPTALMGNPGVGRNIAEARQFLAEERARDPQAFAREYLAEFQDSISGFLPASLVDLAIDTGTYRRPYEGRFTYVAALDPAFRRDAFAFTVVHRDDEGRIVQDAVVRWVSTPGETLNPRVMIEEAVSLARAYSVDLCFTDQYQFESLEELARNQGLYLMRLPFTRTNKASLYGNLQSLFAQRQIRLLDNLEQARELKSLERTMSGQGTVLIAAPPGLYDDMTSVLTLAVSQAQMLYPKKQEPDKKRTTTGEELPFDIIMRQLDKKRTILSAYD